MPKQKTKKAVSKRFKVTKKGKVLHRSHYLRHLRAKKGKKRIRRLKKMKVTTGKYAKKIKRMMGIK